MRLERLSDQLYGWVHEILCMSQAVMEYYNSHPEDEDRIDHTYQYLQRLLRSTSYYQESIKHYSLIIRLTKRFIPQSKILCDYYEYIIYCLKKEEQTP
jgi:hypothetical protein